jgi:hypothetical protein
MGKLVLFFVLASFTHSEVKPNVVSDQAEEVREFVYWDAFSKVFNQTADFWKAESAALEAESIATSKTGVDSWLAENSNNINEVKVKDQCVGNI